MTIWMRFREPSDAGGSLSQDAAVLGRVSGDRVEVYRGDLFGMSEPEPTGVTLALESVEPLVPCVPGAFIGLWNNYHAAAEKQGLGIPKEPLYFLKGSNTYLAHGQTIPAPAAYDGRVIYEGELGIVIGRSCRGASEEEAAAAIFGYTCVNDVTALELLTRDPSFPQWTRAKGYDGFGPFGPVIATGLDSRELAVRTSLNGRERQNYPCADMIFSPPEIVSRISMDRRLEPGDLIACGTSLGIAPLRAGCTVEVSIDGIGTLSNRYE